MKRKQVLERLAAEREARRACVPNSVGGGRVANLVKLSVDSTLDHLKGSLPAHGGKSLRTSIPTTAYFDGYDAGDNLTPMGRFGLGIDLNSHLPWAIRLASGRYAGQKLPHDYGGTIPEPQKPVMVLSHSKELLEQYAALKKIAEFVIERVPSARVPLPQV